jgi:hypothetical protein
VHEQSDGSKAAFPSEKRGGSLARLSQKHEVALSGQRFDEYVASYVGLALHDPERNRGAEPP